MTLLKYGLGVGRIVKATVFGKSTKLSASLVVPPSKVTAINISPNPSQVVAYNNITNAWSNNENDGVHLMYPSMLTAPLQFEVLSSDSFPFPLLGLVHLSNRIQQFEHITLNTKCKIEVSLEDKLTVHEKGYIVNMICEIFCENTNKLLWRSTGGMFHFDKKAKAASEASRSSHPLYQSEIKQENMEGTVAREIWHHSADMGRRYAAVSGDYNPIHLSALSASLFGFKKGAILHGMWTKARAVTALMPPTHTLSSTGSSSDTPMADIFVEFKTPLYLPSSTVLCAKESVAASRKEVIFEVKGNDVEQLPHVRGRCSWNV
jgi:hypothetical protein